MDPSTVKQTYEDIDNIIKSNPDKFKVHEEHTVNGKFKSFTVTT